MDVQVEFDQEVLLAEGDPDRIKQVIINLLDNAIKFNREGMVTAAADNPLKRRRQC
jgi:signal transduction histidine kinase